MKNFFKATDFFTPLVSNEVASIANKKLSDYLESLLVVYGVAGTTEWSRVRGDGDTHKARLFGIEEIKKETCKHEPATFEINNTFYAGIYNPKLGGYQHEKQESSINVFSNKCKHCGIELVATWSEK